MTKQEAQVLHGLYFYRELVEEEMLYSATEINWLVQTPIPKTKEWRSENGAPKSIETQADNYLASIAATSAASSKPLAYLQAAGYISYKKDRGGFRVRVSGAGADLARELDTRIGRANLFYKRHKDGLLWFIATVLVSIVTTLLTNNFVI